MSTTMWNPTRHEDYDTLKGFDVYSADQEKLGTVKEILHPQSTSTTARGGHYFKIEPGMMKKLFSDQDEVFVSEAMIERVLPADDRIVLTVTKDRIEHEDWSKSRDIETFRRS